MQPMTDATGRSFLSYRRTRINEARLLIEAQHEVGIPTWQDLTELEEGHTEEQLRSALADPATANAVVWLTPDVETSTVITRVELPAIVARMEVKDRFFMIPVAAGGLDRTAVTNIAGSFLGRHDLAQWNVQKVSGNPFAEDEAERVAARVLSHRVAAVTAQLGAGDPFCIVLNTRKRPTFQTGMGLSMDWTHCFSGREVIDATIWEKRLLPALETVAGACEERVPGRRFTAEGLCSLPTAVALGSAFLATRRLPIAWRQVSPKRPPELWSLDVPPAASGFSMEVRSGQTSADDMAVLVSVASDVEPAFGASRASLPQFRGFVCLTKTGAHPHDLASSAEASDVVRLVLEGLRQARTKLQPRGTVHLFLAVPAGLAMMIGQVLNTFGPIQTYEHMPTDAVGLFKPATLLRP